MYIVYTNFTIRHSRGEFYAPDDSVYRVSNRRLMSRSKYEKTRVTVRAMTSGARVGERKAGAAQQRAVRYVNFQILTQWLSNGTSRCARAAESFVRAPRQRRFPVCGYVFDGIADFP